MSAPATGCIPEVLTADDRPVEFIEPGRSPLEVLRTEAMRLAAVLVLRGRSFSIQEDGEVLVCLDERGILRGDRVFIRTILDSVEDIKHRTRWRRWVDQERREQSEVEDKTTHAGGVRG